MARATFYNKRLLGHIDDTDFTDYQGIGSDPLYKRYKSCLLYTSPSPRDS